MKKILALLLAAVLVLGMAACAASPAAPTQTTSDTASDASDTPASNAETPAASSGAKLRFVTGGESGTYYAFGSVIAQHATNNAGVDIVGLVGNGSQSNIFELEDGNAELAFCQSDVMAYAYDGTNLFADTGAVSCFSTVAALYTEQVQIVTTDPEIKSVDDLKGKNVSIGAAGSGVYFNAMDVLSAYGLTESDINPTYQSFGDSADSLKNGQIDAAFIVAGAPTTAITDLATTKDVYLVSLTSTLTSCLPLPRITLRSRLARMSTVLTLTPSPSPSAQSFSPATTFPRMQSTSWSPISSITPPASSTHTPSTQRSAPNLALPSLPSPIIRALPSTSPRRALTFPPSKVSRVLYA